MKMGSEKRDNFKQLLSLLKCVTECFTSLQILNANFTSTPTVLAVVGYRSFIFISERVNFQKNCQHTQAHICQRLCF